MHDEKNKGHKNTSCGRRRGQIHLTHLLESTHAEKLKEDKIDPPIRTGYCLSGGATSFFGFLSSVYCIPSRTVYTERTCSHPQSGTGALNCKEEDLVVHKIPRDCVLFENFNNVNDERL